MANATETEVKIAVSEPHLIRQSLERAGFRVSQEREFESNTLYDSRDSQLRSRGMLIRLRQSGKRGLLTWKGPVEPGPHKSRPELETSVGSIATLGDILTHLGYGPVFRYEKFRTEFRRADEPGAIVFDETPIGNFLEIEGEGDWIDKTAEELGFVRSNYILDSYAGLYVKWCERKGMQPEHMVFSS